MTKSKLLHLLAPTILALPLVIGGIVISTIPYRPVYTAPTTLINYKQEMSELACEGFAPTTSPTTIRKYNTLSISLNEGCCIWNDSFSPNTQSPINIRAFGTSGAIIHLNVHCSENSWLGIGFPNQTNSPFSNCLSLEDVTLTSDYLINLNRYTFYNCENLSKLTIDSPVMLTLEKDVDINNLFWNCPLKTLQVANSLIAAYQEDSVWGPFIQAKHLSIAPLK